MSPHDESLPTPDQVRADLVAYLDGELDEVATLAVEQSLSESAEIRQEVESLSKTWDLLETLPPVQASSQFTERTLASLEVTAAPPPTQTMITPAVRRQLSYGALIFGAALCGLLGYLITNRGMSDPSDPIVRDLPVLERLELYRDVEDVEFLEEFEKLGPLAEDPGQEFSNE